MNIELGQLQDNTLVIVNDSPFPHEIRRVEYYRDQRLMMLVYGIPDHEGELMHYELSDVAARTVESDASILIIDKHVDRKMYGYDVPLIQVGL